MGWHVFNCYVKEENQWNSSRRHHSPGYPHCQASLFGVRSGGTSDSSQNDEASNGCRFSASAALEQSFVEPGSATLQPESMHPNKLYWFRRRPNVSTCFFPGHVRYRFMDPHHVGGILFHVGSLFQAWRVRGSTAMSDGYGVIWL